jgi:hypothetical protein
MGVRVIDFSKGWKYRTESGGFAYKLQCQYQSITEYDCPWWALVECGGQWWAIIKNRYSWNGANSFPDFGWIMTPSCLHDMLHEAIDIGAIGTEDNDTIDKELEIAIEGNPASRWAKRQLLKTRGWYVRKATNTADQELGEGVKIYTLPKLLHEYTMQEFFRITGR